MGSREGEGRNPDAPTQMPKKSFLVSWKTAVLQKSPKAPEKENYFSIHFGSETGHLTKEQA